jgi:hypothetical protein
MSDRLEKLLEKYWEAETDLAEEAELKDLLQKAAGYQEEKKFFLGVEELADVKPQQMSMPTNKSWLQAHWMKIAASIVLIIAAGTTYFKYETKKAEREAYQQVMQALALIQENMQKGTSSMQVMQEMKHLNTTQEIFEIPAKSENP